MIKVYSRQNKLRNILMALITVLMISQLWAKKDKKKKKKVNRYAGELVRTNDIYIWDEDYLRGYNGKKGWIVPEDFWEQRSEFEKKVLHGKFGKTSGKVVYTTFRPIRPLSDEEYTLGKKSTLDNQKSNFVMPPFEIELDYITFLISGAKAPNQACINLLFDGKVVRTATGKNSDYLEWAAFDVKEFKGKKVQIQILDSSKNFFDYINIDCICQSPDTKGAIRVIKTAPKKTKLKARIDTVSISMTGTPTLKGTSMSVDDKNINWQNVLKFTNSLKAGNSLARRIEMVNGDRIITKLKSLENNELKVSHPILGDSKLKLTSVAQIKFSEGPSVKLKPGTLLHANGNKIPGEMTWIRKDNISLKCALGQLPLPLSRVNAFVFNEQKLKNTLDKVLLSDGSIIYGKLSINNNHFELNHSEFGKVKLKLSDIAEFSLYKNSIKPLSQISFKVKEIKGPIQPPEPTFTSEKGQIFFRIYPRTVIHFDLAEIKSAKQFKAIIKPVVNSSAIQMILIRCGKKEQKLQLKPDSEGLSIDLDLTAGKELELIIDTTKTVSYPSGVELHRAIIIESDK